MKSTIFAVAVTMMGFMGTGAAKADSFEHIDNLAVRLQRQAGEFRNEVRAHWRNTPEYYHLYQDANSMYRLAAHIHEMAHSGGNLGHIRNDVNELDTLFHHLEDVVNNIDDHDFHDHWQVGWGHGGVSFGHGRRDVRHLKRALRQLEDTLHHLQDDLN